METFRDFFKIGTKSSMARLLSFICACAACLTSIGAIWLGLTDSLSTDYVVLVGTLWGAAFGGKNWSKSVENKEKKDA